jgi:hypothetical protein
VIHDSIPSDTGNLPIVCFRSRLRVFYKKFPHCVGRGKLIVVLGRGPFMGAVQETVKHDLDSLLAMMVTVPDQVSVLHRSFLRRRIAVVRVKPKSDRVSHRQVIRAQAAAVIVNVRILLAMKSDDRQWTYGNVCNRNLLFILLVLSFVFS